MRFFNTVSLILLIVIAQNVFAKGSDRVQELKKRKLIVAMLSENEEYVKKLENDPKKLQEYRKSIQEFNDMFKKTVEKYWTLNNQLEYKTIAEINKIKQYESVSKFYACIMVTLDNYYPELATPGELRNKITYLQVYLMDKKQTMQWCPLPDMYPSEVDMVYGVRLLNNFCEAMAVNEEARHLVKVNAPRLKDKTLLLSKDQIGDLTEAEIKEVYPYAFKIVDNKTLQEAIVNAAPGFAYVIVTDDSDGIWIKNVMLTEDGQQVGYAMASRRKQEIIKGDLHSFISFVK